MVWIRMASTGSYIWMLSHWEWHYLERISVALLECHWGWASRFQKPKPGYCSDFFFLLPVNSDVELSDTYTAQCLPVCGHDNNGLNLWNSKPVSIKCFLLWFSDFMIIVSLHSNRTVIKIITIFRFLFYFFFEARSYLDWSGACYTTRLTHEDPLAFTHWVLEWKACISRPSLCSIFSTYTAFHYMEIIRVFFFFFFFFSIFFIVESIFQYRLYDFFVNFFIN